MNAEIEIDAASVKILRLARELRYPPTPDIAGRVASRLTTGVAHRRAGLSPVWAAVIVLGIFGALMAVPPVRAFVFEFIGIGAIRIETGGRLGSLEFPPAETVSLQAVLSAPTSLADARRRTGHALPLPSYPEDLAEPDLVYHEPLVDGWAVFMLWSSTAGNGRVRLSLAAIRSSTATSKTNPAEIVETTVDGQRAVWASGPHMLMLPVAGGDWVSAQILVEGNVLIWESGDVTWRLESGLDIEAMRRIAESIGG